MPPPVPLSDKRAALAAEWAEHPIPNQRGARRVCRLVEIRRVAGAVLLVCDCAHVGIGPDETAAQADLESDHET